MQNQLANRFMNGAVVVAKATIVIIAARLALHQIGYMVASYVPPQILSPLITALEFYIVILLYNYGWITVPAANPLLA